MHICFKQLRKLHFSHMDGILIEKKMSFWATGGVSDFARLCSNSQQNSSIFGCRNESENDTEKHPPEHQFKPQPLHREKAKITSFVRQSIEE